MGCNNLKELRENLGEHIQGLGINPKFLDNPAYDSVISEIDGLISQMNALDDVYGIPVREENGVISFKWNSPIGGNYFMRISSFSLDSFRAVMVVDNPPYLDIRRETVCSKDIVEKVASIDETGFITLITNGISLNDINCNGRSCNNWPWSFRKYYTDKGVMSEFEYKSFSEGKLSETLERSRIDSALYIPRQAFQLGFWDDKYVERTLLVRDKLDTAKILVEDKSQNFMYRSVTQLSLENGLSNMSMIGGDDPYPEEVIIPPLSTQQIEQMIQSEPNSKIAEGLRYYAKGRDSYYYDSRMDKNFVNTRSQVSVSGKAK